MITSKIPSGYTDQYNPKQDADSLEVKRYLSLFISNWYWFAAALFISFSMAYGINRYSERIYNVSATLLIKDDQNSSIENLASNVVPGGDIFKSRQKMSSELAILRSYSLNRKVMEELKDFHVVYISVGARKIAKRRMYKDSPFIVKYDSLENEEQGRIVGIEILSDQNYRIELNGGLNFDTVMSFSERFSKYGFNFIIEKRDPNSLVYKENQSNKYDFYFLNSSDLANEYRSKLSVVQIEKESSVVRLTVTGFVPEQEADYLNELMDVYINDGLEYKKKIAESTIAFINEQISKISDSLEFAATKLENFRMENSFISLSNEGTLIQNKLLENGTQKSLIELKLQYYDYLSEYLNDKNRGDSIISPSVLEITDQALLALVSELASLKKEKENLEFNLVINQQALVFNSRQIEITTEALKENVRNGIANLRLAKEEIEKRIALVGTEIKKLPSTERELIKIQRQFDLNNTVYTYLLEKRAEAGIVKASTLADNRTIDPAQYLGVGFIRPKTTANFLIALILGLMVPLLLIIAIDYFYDKVIDKKDIERKTKVPVIGYISHNESLNELAVVERPGSLLAESFRSVRTAIKYYVKENETTVIGVSSTITSEGKTFISINLAAIIAMVGKKVLLIGFDLRKPRINKVFGFDNSFSGMSTYLSSNCEYDEIIKATGIDNLYYAPSGPVPPNPAELIETEQMKKFMDRARNEFDYIIIDTPPIAIVTDTLLLGPYIDVNLFIVRQRYSSRSTLELIEQMNNQGLLKNMAIVMNDISLSGYYSYGMRYGYLRGYGFIYGNAYYGSKYYERLYKSDKTKGYYKDE